MTESYVPVPDASLAIGKPVTSTLAKILRSNPIAIAQGHTDAEPIWAQAMRYAVIASSQNWEVPQGVRKVYVRMRGGGGGGSGGMTAGYQSGGGAGGAAEGWLDVVPGTIIAITIGVAGIAASFGGNGGNGGTTSFGSMMSATGGLGGKANGAASTTYQSFYANCLQCRGGIGVGATLVDRGSAGVMNEGNSNGIGYGEGGLGIGALGGNTNTVAQNYGDGGRSGAWGGTTVGFAGKQGVVEIWY